MIHTILNILLIGVIVTCPIRCLAGLCPSSDACCGAVKSCCSHCILTLKNADKDADPHSNAPLEPSRSGGCQCICSGALVGSSDILLVEQVQHTWLGLLVPDDLATPLAAAAELSDHPPDWAVVASGQSLCILHRALLL